MGLTTGLRAVCMARYDVYARLGKGGTYLTRSRCRTGEIGGHCEVEDAPSIFHLNIMSDWKRTPEEKCNPVLHPLIVSVHLANCV